jgi:hypothetical protein
MLRIVIGTDRHRGTSQDRCEHDENEAGHDETTHGLSLRGLDDENPSRVVKNKERSPEKRVPQR